MRACVRAVCVCVEGGEVCRRIGVGVGPYRGVGAVMTVILLSLTVTPTAELAPGGWVGVHPLPRHAPRTGAAHRLARGLSGTARGHREVLADVVSRRPGLRLAAAVGGRHQRRCRAIVA